MTTSSTYKLCKKFGPRKIILDLDPINLVLGPNHSIKQISYRTIRTFHPTQSISPKKLFTVRQCWCMYSMF
jgi:hypothetical protein